MQARTSHGRKGETEGEVIDRLRAEVQELEHEGELETKLARSRAWVSELRHERNVAGTGVLIAVAVAAALVALALIFGLHIGGGNNPPQPAASPPSQIVDATISQDGIQLDRDVVPAGLVRIEVRNLGLTAHSMLVGRVSHGITDIRPYPGPGPEQAALSLAPGEADVLAVRLSQGAYVLYQLEPGGSRVEDLTVTP